MTQPGSELRQLIRIAIPLALTQLGFQVMGVVDTAFAGHISDTALGATGLGSSLFFGATVIGVGVSLALDPLAAQAFGAGELPRARRILWQGLWAAAIMTLPISFIVVALVAQLEAFGVAAELAVEARIYVWARLPQLFLLLASVALRSYLQAAHVTRAVLWATVWANLANIAGNFAFGIGVPELGLPGYGVRGLAWATVLATAAQAAVLAYAAKHVETGALEPGWRRPERALLRRIFAIGLPIGSQLVAEVGLFSAVQVLMARIGVLAAASHQVALMLASLTFSICLGLGAATSVQVGRAIGRGDALGTRHAGLSGIGLGAAFMFVMAIIMWLVPEALTRPFTDDREVVSAAAGLLRIAGAFQIVDGVQAVASGALRGAGVTRWALAANLVAHWGVGMPVAIALAFGAGMGPAGLWWGLTAGLAVAALALAGKFVTLSSRPIERLTAA